MVGISNFGGNCDLSPFKVVIKEFNFRVNRLPLWENPPLTVLLNNGTVVCKRSWFCGHGGFQYWYYYFVHTVPQYGLVVIY